MKVGICIDPWKLPVFEDILKRNNYQFDITPGTTFTVIRVELTSMADAATLQAVVEKCQLESARREAELKNLGVN